MSSMESKEDIQSSKMAPILPQHSQTGRKWFLEFEGNAFYTGPGTHFKKKITAC